MYEACYCTNADWKPRGHDNAWDFDIKISGFDPCRRHPNFRQASQLF